jgi:hypothetical protein
MSRLVLVAACVAVIYGQKPPSVGVFIDFDAVPSERSVAAMKKEAGDILSSAGFQLDWRLLSQNRGEESFSNVVVVKFRGKCRLEYPAQGSDVPDTLTLASTLVADGHVLPYSEVRCDEIRKVLPYTAQGRQQAMGRALGRVVAHELYHLLVDTTKHTGTGLAKATINGWELITGKESFRGIENFGRQTAQRLPSNSLR